MSRAFFSVHLIHDIVYVEKHFSTKTALEGISVEAQKVMTTFLPVN